MDKKTVRKELLSKRKEIPIDKKVIYDKEISKKIINSNYFKNAVLPADKKLYEQIKKQNKLK